MHTHTGEACTAWPFCAFEQLSEQRHQADTDRHNHHHHMQVPSGREQGSRQGRCMHAFCWLLTLFFSCSLSLCFCSPREQIHFPLITVRRKPWNDHVWSCCITRLEWSLFLDGETRTRLAHSKSPFPLLNHVMESPDGSMVCLFFSHHHHLFSQRKTAEWACCYMINSRTSCCIIFYRGRLR